MKKVMMGVLTGFLFLAVAAQATYANECGCSGPTDRGRMEYGRPAAPWMMHHGGGAMYGQPRAAHFLWRKLMGLGLSDQQKDALKAIRLRVEKDTIRKRADLELARLDLRELLHKDQVDMKAVETSLQKVASVRTDLTLTHIKAWEEAKATLTPEQRAKLKEDLKASFMKHGQRCDGRHGKHESMPPAKTDAAQPGTDAR